MYVCDLLKVPVPLTLAAEHTNAYTHTHVASRTRLVLPLRF